IDSDQSVASYKGYKRPIIGEASRLKIVNELSCVDAVFIKDIRMDKDSHIEFYRNLNIDIITIGPRFECKRILKEEAFELSIPVLEIELEEDTSTSLIVDQIIRKYR